MADLDGVLTRLAGEVGLSWSGFRNNDTWRAWKLPAPDFVWAALMREILVNVAYHARRPIDGGDSAPTTSIVVTPAARPPWRALVVYGESAMGRHTYGAPQDGDTPSLREWAGRLLPAPGTSPDLTEQHGFGLRMVQTVAEIYGVQVRVVGMGDTALGAWLTSLEQTGVDWLKDPQSCGFEDTNAPLSVVFCWRHDV